LHIDTTDTELYIPASLMQLSQPKNNSTNEKLALQQHFIHDYKHDNNYDNYNNKSNNMPYVENPQMTFAEFVKLQQQHPQIQLQQQQVQVNNSSQRVATSTTENNNVVVVQKTENQLLSFSEFLKQSNINNLYKQQVNNNSNVNDNNNNNNNDNLAPKQLFRSPSKENELRKSGDELRIAANTSASTNNNNKNNNSNRIMQIDIHDVYNNNSNNNKTLLTTAYHMMKGDINTVVPLSTATMSSMDEVKSNRFATNSPFVSNNNSNNSNNYSNNNIMNNNNYNNNYNNNNNIEISEIESKNNNNNNSNNNNNNNSNNNLYPINVSNRKKRSHNRISPLPNEIMNKNNSEFSRNEALAELKMLKERIAMMEKIV
jgi:hypothetical protein